MSSIQRGSRRPRHGMREGSDTRRRTFSETSHDSSSDTTNDTNPDTLPPQWFVSYMETFKEEIIADVMKALDGSLAIEEQHQRYRKAYFMLKTRLYALESRMELRNSAQQHSEAADPPLSNGVTRLQHHQHKAQRRSQVVRKNSQNPSSSTSTSSGVDATQAARAPAKPLRVKGAVKTPGNKREDVQGTAQENNRNIPSAKKDSKEIPKRPSTGFQETPDNRLTTTTGFPRYVPQPHILSRSIRGILNQVTASNFQNLVEQIKGLNFHTGDDAADVINQFFEKAFDDPTFSRAYAFLCKQFLVNQPKIIYLRSLIISKCELEFDRCKAANSLRAQKLEELTGATDSVSKSLLAEEFRQLNEENPKEFLGKILFIGELYNEDLLSNHFLHKVIQYLLVDFNETHLEYLCYLLKLCGKNFAFRDDGHSTYYEKLSGISLQRGLSSNIKFMIDELIYARSQEWKQRRDDLEEEHLMDVFSFSKTLDLYCAGQTDDNNFMTEFYNDIQPHFTLFESTNFTREILNSLIERGKWRKQYFEVFVKVRGNKIVEWVGGEHVFLAIVLRQLKMFFMAFERIFVHIPEVWECMTVFLEKFVIAWQVKFGPTRILDILQHLNNKETRRNFAKDLIKKLKENMKEELAPWMNREEVTFLHFLGSEYKPQQKE